MLCIQIPSHFMEFFAREPSVISKWARHNVTGDRIPHELLKDALAKKQGFAGVDLQQQILLSAADQVSFLELLYYRQTSNIFYCSLCSVVKISKK